MDDTIQYHMSRALMAIVSSNDEHEPTSFTVAVEIAKWHEAMNLEFDALLWNNTWQLVSPT